MSVTPGKMGELLKSYLVKQVSNEPISKTAPIVLAERITDFISLILLALLGAYVFDYGKVIVIATGILFVILILVISHKGLSLKIIDTFAGIKFLTKFIPNVHNAYESSYIMLRPKPLTYMLFISLLSWFFECFGFYIILLNFGIDYSVLWPTFVYSFSTIVGAITMLPGGLGVTEGSLTFLMIEKGISKDIAVTATFIVRVVTLWFAVAVGAVSVFLYKDKFGKLNLN